MKIIETTKQPLARVITLNEIPVGQVFKGTVTGTYLTVTGIFQKLYGRCAIDDKAHDVLVITLRDDYASVTKTGIPVYIRENGYAEGHNPLILNCSPVRNYEPLDATLTLSPEGGK